MSQKDTTEDLIVAIDETAIKLLRKASGDAKLSGDESALFMEQVKGFEAVVRWASLRGPLLPKGDAPKETKFAGIKRTFNSVGGKAKRGRGSGAAAVEGRAAGSDADAGDSDSGGAPDAES